MYSVFMPHSVGATAAPLCPESIKSLIRLILTLCISLDVLAADNAKDQADLTVLVPGFTVTELPVRIPNINNLRFAPDRSLIALGYNGQIWRLTDEDGDGIEEAAKTYWDGQSLSVPVGMVWTSAGLVVSSHGKVSRLRDHDRDGRADAEEILASGWPATDVASGGVDATSVTSDSAGNLYFGLLTADYSNPYRVKDGVSQYDLKSPRGSIQKWNVSTRSLETVATGIRVPYALAFNRAGDLFVTDQEGETWCPNGNPLDELNHIVQGRNYGFPPRHDQWLPRLVSEEPVVGFGPQHQSACGFAFNDSSADRRRFGPGWWEGDAFVAGESRGKIWRVKLVKTRSGYVGQDFLFARSTMLVTDVAISPMGDLYVSAHSGQPDWGTGPNGVGKLFRIRWTGQTEPQPVAVWASGLMGVRVAFDRPIDPRITRELAGMEIEFGPQVRAADRMEVLKPPYKVVKRQESTPRGRLPVLGATLSDDGSVLQLKTGPQPQSVHYALRLPGMRGASSASSSAVDLDYTLGGVEARWFKNGGKTPDWTGWLPHLDDKINRAMTEPATEFGLLRAKPGSGGRLELSTAITFAARTNVLTLEAEGELEVELNGVRKSSTRREGRHRLDLAVLGGGESVLLKVVRHRWDRDSMHASVVSDLNPEPRPVPLRALRLPWSPPPPPVDVSESDSPATEWKGGDFKRGRELFFGERLKCATCHRIRGEGGEIGVDLTNLVHRDAASVLRDIVQPNASIHPDYVAYIVETVEGSEWQGFVRAQNAESLRIVTADGKEHTVLVSKLKSLRPSTVSLMPSGLLDGLSESQIRDLMMFLFQSAPR